MVFPPDVKFEHLKWVKQDKIIHFCLKKLCFTFSYKDDHCRVCGGGQIGLRCKNAEHWLLTKSEVPLEDPVPGSLIE